MWRRENNTNVQCPQVNQGCYVEEVMDLCCVSLHSGESYLELEHEFDLDSTSDLTSKF